jgi:hypothetical protein
VEAGLSPLRFLEARGAIVNCGDYGQSMQMKAIGVTFAQH